MHYGEGMINKELEITIEATVRDAEARRHEYLTVEHVLLPSSMMNGALR